MLLRALAFLRAVQFALWLWVPFVGDGLSAYPLQVPVGYVLAALFSAVLFGTAIRRDALPGRWVAADVVLAVAYALVISRSYPPVEAASISNWVIPPLCGVTVTAAIYGGRYRSAAVAAVIAAWVVGAWPAVGTDSRLELLTNSTMMTLFAVVAGFTGKLLLAGAVAADDATARAVTAENAKARVEEEKRQKGLMHDHALQTLQVIAQGAHTMGADKVERLARKDLQFLRTMTYVESGTSALQLGESLATMIRAHTAQVVLDRVESTISTLPADLPEEVVEALTSATCEALNNVVAHARTDWVRVTAAKYARGGIRIAVTDRGAGFDPQTADRRGLERSVTARLEAIGGLATIRSTPGSGTTVELKWPQ
ncbi:ATP-binding protein [Streptomyces sp. NPDC006529]|uniref:sensor histidine kinase n=1 Tax=Streptomyces sp. NPDC006529 TaxID=3157177 RepID=UPI0033B14211